MKKSFSILLLFAMFVISCGPEKDSRLESVFTISTKYGDMVGILYDKTPLHKANFIKLVKEGYYNGTLFHRVIKGFMIQGGDPDSKHVKPGERLGNGGPGYTVSAEILPEYYHEKGALAAARLGDDVNPKRESSGSQFYIVEGKIIPENETAELNVDKASLDKALRQYVNTPKNKHVRDTLSQLYQSQRIEEFQELIFSMIPAIEKETGIRIKTDNDAKIKAYTTVGGYPPLDGQYTVFGKIIKGLEVIDKIAMVQGDEVDRPVEDVPIAVSITEMSRSKIEKEYHYTFPAEIK